MTTMTDDEAPDCWLIDALEDPRVTDFCFRCLAHVHLAWRDGRILSVSDLMKVTGRSEQEVRDAVALAARCGYAGATIADEADQRATHDAPDTVN